MAATYEEILPAQKSSPHNGINWTPGETRSDGKLVIMTARDTVSYDVIECPTHHDGRAFQISKDNGEIYDVYCGRNAQDMGCTCKGFQFGHGKPCKHLLAVQALLANEQLWGRTSS